MQLRLPQQAGFNTLHFPRSMQSTAGQKWAEVHEPDAPGASSFCSSMSHFTLPVTNEGHTLRGPGLMAKDELGASARLFMGTGRVQSEKGCGYKLWSGAHANHKRDEDAREAAKYRLMYHPFEKG